MSGTLEDAEKYSDFVRQQLGEILSHTLTEILEKRPSDPIAYIANRLYEKRKTQPLGSSKVTPTTTGIGTSRMSNGQRSRSRRNLEDDMSMITVKNRPSTENKNSKGKEIESREATEEAKTLLKTMIPSEHKSSNSTKQTFITVTSSPVKAATSSRFDDDDFIEEDLTEYKTFSNLDYVHDFIYDGHHRINDIFDDDDVT